MMSPSSCKRTASMTRASLPGSALLLGALALIGLWSAPSRGWAAEITRPASMSKTLIVLKLDSDEPVAVRTTSQTQPPGILVEFPLKRVVGSLPERSAVGQGVIQAIRTQYHNRVEGQPKRFIRSLHIELSAPYAYQLRSQPGRITIEIDHPASVRSAQVEVGLKGGTIIGDLQARRISERFHAMQEALTVAAPAQWSLRMQSDGAGAAPAAAVQQLESSTSSSAGMIHAVRAQPQSVRPFASPSRFPTGSQAFFWVMLTLLGGAAAWRQCSKTTGVLALRRRFSWLPALRTSAGVVLVDQLVWRAFERQGYQLLLEKELLQPPSGTLRVIVKDHTKSVLLCAGNGPFFEKHAIEQFIRVMREARVEHGFLVAAGSFTVPAQRAAKANRVTLIGREELTELLSAGAASEHITKQLEQERTRLEEARETLRQYAAELDTLRRQRNEASWYLGEERAKSAKFEADLADLGQQLRAHETQLQRWEASAATLRKQWEESEWYLGEVRVRNQYLEAQLSVVPEAVQCREAAERQRDDANSILHEERAKRESLETLIEQLQRTIETSSARERELQEAFDRLRGELTSLRTHWGERRGSNRWRIPEIQVELSGETNDPLFSGASHDVGIDGFGLETDQEVPSHAPLRARLRIPGSPEAIETDAQLVWQHHESPASRYHSGFRISNLAPEARVRLELAVEQIQGGPGG